MAFTSQALGDQLTHATNVLNPKVDSSATLEVKEWDNGRLVQESAYKAIFLGQDSLLLRKTNPEKDRGRSILVVKNRLWVELPSARRPVQLSTEQRWTSDALFADLARANFSRDYAIRNVVAEAGPNLALHFSLQANQKDVPYSSVELWIEKTTGRPRHAQFTTASRALVRNCSYDSFQKVVGEERPTRFVFSDPARPNWKAELVFKDWLPARANLKLFDPASLGKEESVTTPARRYTSDSAGAMPGGGEQEHLVFIPDGAFTMGRNNGFPDEQPAHRVSVAGFWIDRTEVTVQEYEQFLRAKGYPLPERPESSSMPRDYFSNRTYRDFPIVDVTWKKAKEYCQWRHKRLPSEAEWEKAARGTDERLYPWGNQWDGEIVNSRESIVSSLPDSLRHFTRKVGSSQGNASPYGVLDMAGNVWEWVDSWYTAYPGNANSNDAYGQQYKVVRGGSWVSNSLSLLTVARDFSLPDFGYDSIGFRCAKDGTH